MSATPTPEQVAERLEAIGDALFTAERNTLREAAALIRTLAAREARMRGLLERIEPSIGWRSATGTSRDFACEFCHQTHEHFALIKHTEACPVVQVRAALGDAP